MKQLHVLFAITFLLINTAWAAPEADGNEKYSSKVGKVTVYFPGSYTEEKSREDYGDSYTIKSLVGDDAYMLSFVIHSNDLSTSNLKELAQISLDAFAEEIGGKMSGEKDYVYKGNEGRMCDIKMDNGLYIRYKCIIIGQIQYQLIAIISDRSKSSDTMKKFFESFKSTAK